MPLCCSGQYSSAIQWDQKLIYKTCECHKANTMEEMKSPIFKNHIDPNKQPPKKDEIINK